jgi:hypothetical protein
MFLMTDFNPQRSCWSGALMRSLKRRGVPGFVIPAQPIRIKTAVRSRLGLRNQA